MKICQQEFLKNAQSGHTAGEKGFGVAQDVGQPVSDRCLDFRQPDGQDFRRARPEFRIVLKKIANCLNNKISSPITKYYCFISVTRG